MTPYNWKGAQGTFWGGKILIQIPDKPMYELVKLCYFFKVGRLKVLKKHKDSRL